jgi:hypothetical protein
VVAIRAGAPLDVALATVSHSGGMETWSLGVGKATTTKEKTTRLFSSSWVVSVRRSALRRFYFGFQN